MQTNKQDSRNKRIYLIGMMGSGKSHWAGRLGRHFGLPHYDLDHLIEQQAGQSIKEIFSGKGEPYFRQLESDMLQEKVPSSEYILACGGGTPCFHNNLDFMKANGVVIWLHPPLDELIKRLKKAIDHRPILAASASDAHLEENLKALATQREKWYSQAHFIVSDESPLLDDFVYPLEKYL